MVAYNLRKVENRDRYPDPPRTEICVRRHSIGAVPRLVAPIAWVRFPVAAFWFFLLQQNKKHSQYLGVDWSYRLVTGGSSVGRAVDCKVPTRSDPWVGSSNLPPRTFFLFLLMLSLPYSRADSVAETGGRHTVIPR